MRIPVTRRHASEGDNLAPLQPSITHAPLRFLALERSGCSALSCYLARARVMRALHSSASFCYTHAHTLPMLLLSRLSPSSSFSLSLSLSLFLVLFLFLAFSVFRHRDPDPSFGLLSFCLPAASDFLRANVVRLRARSRISQCHRRRAAPAPSRTRADARCPLSRSLRSSST